MLEELLFLVLAILVIWYVAMSLEFPVMMVRSSIDNREYRVKEKYGNSQEAANILAKLNAVNHAVINHMIKKYAKTSLANKVKFMADNYNGDVLQEHTPRTTTNTSYVLGKGEEIKMCLRDKETGKFFDMNTLVFVDLHELSHLFDYDYGHEKQFWEGFKVILGEAVELGLYDPIDYSKHATKYCGMTITDNPYF
jgi:WLM domain